MSDAQVKSIIERILRLHAEEDELKADRREIYGEAKANGYDKTALGAAVALIRKRNRLGEDAIAERETIVGLYLDAYDNAPRAHTHAPARGHETAPPESHPAVQSEAAADASSEQGSAASAAGKGVGHISAHADQFVTRAGAEEGPASPADPAPAAERTSFLAKPYVLRPHCKRPDRCGSYGAKHCFDCVPVTSSEAA